MTSRLYPEHYFITPGQADAIGSEFYASAKAAVFLKQYVIEINWNFPPGLSEGQQIVIKGQYWIALKAYKRS